VRIHGPAALPLLALLSAGCAHLGSEAPIRPDPAIITRRVASRAAADHRVPPPFDWGEGVLMSGMVRAGVSAGAPEGVLFVRSWADHWIQAGIGPLLDEKGYCGHWGPALAVAQLSESCGGDPPIRLADEVGDFIQFVATRAPDGGLGHWRGNRQLWIDTLYMAAPVLASIGRLERRADRLGEALAQMRIFARRLRDPRTGLYRHMFDEEAGSGTEAFWARGNGWAAMAHIEVLRRLEPGTAGWRELRDGLRDLLAAVCAVQDRETGLWHTVLDRPETYLETSASAMFLYVLVEGERLGALERTHGEIIRRAWTGLAARVDGADRVVGTSAGTMPGTLEKYAAVPVGEYPWGTGAFLLAAGALADLQAGRKP